MASILHTPWFQVPERTNLIDVKAGKKDLFMITRLCHEHFPRLAVFPRHAGVRRGLAIVQRRRIVGYRHTNSFSQARVLRHTVRTLSQSHPLGTTMSSAPFS